MDWKAGPGRVQEWKECVQPRPIEILRPVKVCEVAELLAKHKNLLAVVWIRSVISLKMGSCSWTAKNRENIQSSSKTSAWNVVWAQLLKDIGIRNEPLAE